MAAPVAQLDRTLQGMTRDKPDSQRGQGAWLVVLLLSLMFAMSLLDRQILAILANPVAQALHIPDTQLGFLMGTSFAVLYSIVSLPVAHGIDTYNRKRLVVLGVALWSAMTIASAFATGFTMLLLFRSGVAIGEAVLTPAAVSLIADMFSKEKRALPTTVFTSIGAAMATASFLVGGVALSLAGRWTHALALAPWRLTFIIVGVPGLLIALAFLLFTTEPERADHGLARADEVSFDAFLSYLKKHWWFYAPFLAATSVFAMFTYSLFSWVPTIMIRAHGYKAAGASSIFGFVMTPLQMAAMYVWPRVAMRIEKKHLNKGVPLTLLFASLWAAPFYILAPLMTGDRLFVGGICLAIITAGAFGLLPAIGFQIFCPARMRGRITALNLLFMNLVGYGLGPVLTVYLGNAWSAVKIPAQWGLTTNPLARGLASIGLIAVPIMILCTFLCVRLSRRMPAVV